MITIRKILILSAVIILIAFIPLYLHLTTTTREFARYNQQWNGTSLLFSDLEGRGAVPIRDMQEIQAYPGSRLLILAPDRPFTPAEARAVRAYLEGGNTLVLADDFGTGNDLLQGMGSGIRLLPGNLSSVDLYLWDPQTGRFYPSAVIGFVAREDILTRGVEEILLNKPVALEGGEPLAGTSVLSWVDRNSDQRVNANESFGRYDILARERVGAGSLYVLSDPSIFVNSMVQLDLPANNTRLIKNILDAEVLLVDQVHSRTSAEEGILPLLLLARSTMIIKIMMIALLSIIVAVLFQRRIL